MNSNDNNTLVNPHFELVVLWIQANIGKVISTLLVLTYLGTALMIAVSLHDALLLIGNTMAWIVAAVMAVLTQAIRGSLVYFNQANPYRVGSLWEKLGLAFALILTVFACFEVYHLFAEQGLGTAAMISANGLIIAGFFLEAYFLGEINRTNRSVLIANPDLIQLAIDFEEKFAELQIQISEAQIKMNKAKRRRLSGAIHGSTPAPAPTPKPAPAPLPEPEPEEEEGFELDFSVNGNGKAKN